MRDANSKRGYLPLSATREPTGTSENLQSGRGVLAPVKSLCQNVAKVFDLSLMMDYNFWIVTFIYVVTRVTRGAWIIYFVPHAVSKGFSADSAAIMVTAAGLGHLGGVLLVSVALFKEMVTSTRAMLIVIVLIATSLFIDPWMAAGWMMSANAVLFMATMGAVFALGDVMVKEFFGYGKMAGAYGWMGATSGIFRFFSGFIPGWIYDHTGGYDRAFIIMGGIQIVTVCPLLVKILHSYCSQQRRRNKAT